MKQIVLDFLKNENIPFEITEHEPVYTMEDMERVGLDKLGTICKNLFIRDAKGKLHFLITADNDTQVNLKEIGAKLDAGKVSFASAERLEKYLGVTAGCVSPFGILNDTEHCVTIVLDKKLEGKERLGIHPNEHDAMSVEIIYEKKYPRINPMEEMKQIEMEMADEPEEPTPSFDEIMQKIQENTTYVLMPERIKASEDFIWAAIEVSELYELDTKIERHFDHISVDYSFNCCGGLRDINRVIGMADQTSFFKDIFGWDITISLDFFTHAVVRNGRVVAP